MCMLTSNCHHLSRTCLLFHACRPLPASRALSQSISLDSATRVQQAGRSKTQTQQASDTEQAPEQAPVIAPQPLHSPFEAPPSGVPTRHEGPFVPDHGHIGPTTSLVPPDAVISASSELAPVFDSRTGSTASQVCLALVLCTFSEHPAHADCRLCILQTCFEAAA